MISLITTHPDFSDADSYLISMGMKKRRVFSHPVYFGAEYEENAQAKNLQSKDLKKRFSHHDFISHSGQFQNQNVKKLLCIDMDSTTIQIEVIDEIAKLAGIGDKIKEITELAMNGKIAFDESLHRRVALLKGLERSRLDTIELPFTRGATKFFSALKKCGFHTALITGGFDIFAEKIAKELFFDSFTANQLELDREQKLTGNVIPPIINAEAKARIMLDLAKQNSIRPENILSIGDGANDIPMLQQAGLGIAFNAKQTTKEKAPASIDIVDLEVVLVALGITS